MGPHAAWNRRRETWRKHSADVCGVLQGGQRVGRSAVDVGERRRAVVVGVEQVGRQRGPHLGRRRRAAAAVQRRAGQAAGVEDRDVPLAAAATAGPATVTLAADDDRLTDDEQHHGHREHAA